ncbi:DMT family transporter [Pseudalkalibacillus berkeleyi]|uniref:DMT family transporter n=1 Tax=Pseudalkalibacillus berkeleyi TaxID=1069813 RepID=A0ABS9GYA9_9BACL|nr:DMT family transporter [Pseudalkalibacillus berkeleyi]MCF6136736.1 DMT family transporter [Pseudalkalibacillus berkeleyi]
MKKDPIINPYLAICIGVLSVSTSAVLVKLSSAPAPIIAGYRLLFTTLLMTPFILIYFRRDFIKIERRDLVFCLFAGVFLAFHFILWFESLNYTSVASSVVLVALQPIFAFIGTYIFFSEKLTLKAILGGSLAIGGSILISWGDFQISGMALFGDLLALLGAIAVTVYYLFGQNVRKRLHLMTYTFIVYGMATCTLLIYSLSLGYKLGPYPGQDWVYFILLALFPTLLGHTIFNWALKHVSTTVISMSILGEPIGASILAYFLLDEFIRAEQLVGGLIILIGIYLFLKRPRNKQSQQVIANPAKGLHHHE